MRETGREFTTEKNRKRVKNQGFDFFLSVLLLCALCAFWGEILFSHVPSCPLGSQ
jgi:hypothetical protein